MTYDKSVQDIIDYTGLKYDYIRKCLSKFSDVFEPHIKRGDKNSIIFNSNALQLFDQIKQMKEQGFTLNIIKEHLDNIPKPKLPEETIQTLPNLPQTDYIENMLKEIKEATKEAINAKDQTIQAKDEALKSKEEHIKVLESKILLITDGRTPEQVKEEQRQKEESLRRQAEELLIMKNELKNRELEINNIKATSEAKAKELQEQKLKEENLRKQAEKLLVTENELKNRQSELSSVKALAEAKTKELEEQKKALEEIKLREKEKEEKKKTIFAELKKLEGKYFQGKRKKELLEQLEALN